MPLSTHNARVRLSSESEDWATPRDFYQRLDQEFGFTLDVCASADNHKCPRYIDKATDAFKADWAADEPGAVVAWMNPPYGRSLPHWMALAFEWSLRGVTVVCLVPNRVGSRWWTTWVLGKADEVRFVNGRLAFGGASHTATFESAVIVYRPPCRRQFTHYTHIDRSPR